MVLCCRSHHGGGSHDAAQRAGGQGDPHRGGRDRQLPEGTVLLAQGPKADGSHVIQVQKSHRQGETDKVTVRLRQSDWTLTW